MKGERMPLVCPICNDEIASELVDHLVDVHTKRELAEKIHSDFEAEREQPVD
ncbi:hypothetical protein ACNS7O_17970 (plasmid) [Haloferacaceae archaeon DSL9]